MISLVSLPFTLQKYYQNFNDYKKILQKGIVQKKTMQANTHASERRIFHFGLTARRPYLAGKTIQGTCSIEKYSSINLKITNIIILNYYYNNIKI